MRKLLIFFTLLFISLNVNAATISTDYKLYEKLSDEEKMQVDSVPEKYVEVYNNNFTPYKQSQTITKAAPTSYDLRKYITINPTNQGSYNTCYIFATMTSLATTLEKNNTKYYDFSIMHAEYKSLIENGGERSTYGSGGNFRQVADYILTGKGPVLTNDVSYKTYTSSEISAWNYNPFINVAGVVSFPALDKINVTYSESTLTSFRDTVKNHLMNEGALSAVIYAGETGNLTVTQSLNKNSDGTYDNVLYYPKQSSNTQSSNHAVTIIGWDDNYPKENFPASNRPTNNGAYLIVNSWGSTYEYIWVSYDDVWIEYEINGFNYDALTDNVNYNLYNNEYGTTSESYYSEAYLTSDYLTYYYGSTADSSDSLHTIYLGNKYTRKTTSAETLKEVILPLAIMTSTKAVSATIYVNPADDSFTKTKLIEVGTISNITDQGYTKLVLDTPISLTGTTFSVVIKMVSVYTFRTVYSGASSYISKDNNNNYQTLKDLSTGNNAIFPMYIRTDTDNNYTIETQTLPHCNMLTLNSGELLRLPVEVNKTLLGDSKVNVAITKNGTDALSSFDILGTEIYNNQALIRIKPHNDIATGFYKIAITYQDSDTLYSGLTITSTTYAMNPNLFSSSYGINSTYINYIKDETTVDDYLKNLTLDSSYNKLVYDSNDTIVTTGTIYTGLKTKYFDGSGNLMEEFTNIVNGDNNGDGEIDIGDIVRASNYILREMEAEQNASNPTYVKPTTFSSDYQRLATDVNHDGEIDIGDIVKLSNYTLYDYEVKSGERTTNPVSL